MRILLLGATGRTGKLTLKELLAKGFEVNALVRSPNKLSPNDRLHIIEGSPANEEMLLRALTDCSVVINLLNISRTSDFPWAKLRSPLTLLSDTARRINNSPGAGSIQQYIACSAWGVHETRPEVPRWFRWFIEHSHIGAGYADHERQENELKKGVIPLTIVRPTFLVNTRKEQVIGTSYNNIPKPKLTISRSSVAKFIVAAIGNEALIGKTPTIFAE